MQNFINVIFKIFAVIVGAFILYQVMVLAAGFALKLIILTLVLIGLGTVSYQLMQLNRRIKGIRARMRGIDKTLR
jgi:hypothetical protein